MGGGMVLACCARVKGRRFHRRQRDRACVEFFVEATVYAGHMVLGVIPVPPRSSLFVESGSCHLAFSMRSQYDIGGPFVVASEVVVLSEYAISRSGDSGISNYLKRS